MAARETVRGRAPAALPTRKVRRTAGLRALRSAERCSIESDRDRAAVAVRSSGGARLPEAARLARAVRRPAGPDRCCAPRSRWSRTARAPCRCTTRCCPASATAARTRGPHEPTRRPCGRPRRTARAPRSIARRTWRAARCTSTRADFERLSTSKVSAKLSAPICFGQRRRRRSDVARPAEEGRADTGASEGLVTTDGSRGDRARRPRGGVRRQPCA
jgi:hypothetical protein